jgi:hypothetical protein
MSPIFLHLIFLTGRGEERKVYKVLLGKPEGKDRWEDQGIDGIRVDLREIGWGGVDWIQLAVASCCECGDESSGSCAIQLILGERVLIRKSLMMQSSSHSFIFPRSECIPCIVPNTKFTLI